MPSKAECLSQQGTCGLSEESPLCVLATMAVVKGCDSETDPRYIELWIRTQSLTLKLYQLRLCEATDNPACPAQAWIYYQPVAQKFNSNS